MWERPDPRSTRLLRNLTPTSHARARTHAQHQHAHAHAATVAATAASTAASTGATTTTRTEASATTAPALPPRAPQPASPGQARRLTDREVGEAQKNCEALTHATEACSCVKIYFDGLPHYIVDGKITRRGDTGELLDLGEFRVLDDDFLTFFEGTEMLLSSSSSSSSSCTNPASPAAAAAAANAVGAGPAR